MSDNHETRDEPEETSPDEGRDEAEGSAAPAEGCASADAAEDEEEPELGADPAASAHEEIDPELLALGEGGSPGPSWHRPVMMAAVLVVIGVMMVWFRAELLYFFTPEEPVDLGEAHEARLGPELDNRYVRFDGMPLAPRNLNPSQRCGQTQGFPTYQRRFLCQGHQSAIPLMGRPEHDLLVQRYLLRRLTIGFIVPEERHDEAIDQAELAVRRVSAVRQVRRARPDELGQLVAEVQGRTGQTDVHAVMQAVRFQLESAVPGIRSITVERVERDPPGSFVGRVVRLDQLGSRFAAVAQYLGECTDYDLAEQAYVVLDGSEAGEDAFGVDALCYGQAPRQYWPYVALYVVLTFLFILNLALLVRFFLARRRP